MQSADAYMVDCRNRGLSPKTCEIYSGYLKQFQAIAKDYGDLPTLRSWLRSIPNQRTAFCAFRVVKTFIRWANREGLCGDWISGERFKFAMAPPATVLTVDEFERIMAVIPKTTRGLRDRALYSLLFYTGARRDAIRLARFADLDITDRYLSIKTKGQKEQVLSLPKMAIARLSIWLIKRPEGEWLFPSMRQHDRAVDARHVSRWLGLYAKRAGFSRRVYPHLLRHSHATALVEAGVSLDVVQAALGHSHISTTQIYARMSARRIREATDLVFG